MNQPQFQPQPQPTPETPNRPAVVSLADRGRMLPGIALIAMFLLFLTLVNVFAALTNKFPGLYRGGVLALCTLLVAGIFGLLRMRRWGHAIVMAGCLLLSAGYLYYYSRVHQLPALVQGLFMLLFFLYLVRPEVRDRML